LIVEEGIAHFGGPQGVYNLTEVEMVEVIARIRIRDHREGWAHTLAPQSTVERVYFDHAVHEARQAAKPSSPHDFNRFVEGR